MVHEKHEKETVYPDMPPWTMFFDGPLYDKYDEFMKNKDFSKILLSTKLKLASSSHPDVTDTIRSTDSDWWTGKSPNDSYPDRVVPPNMYNSFSHDEVFKEDEARRTRRTRAFILICILIMAALALGTALVIHYLVIPPRDTAAKSHVNISFSENSTKPDSTQQYATTTLPSKPGIHEDEHRHIEPNKTEHGAHQPQGNIFDGTPDNGKMVTGKPEETQFEVPSTTTDAHNTTTPMPTTTSLDPLDFFAMDMMSTTETSSSIKTWTPYSSTPESSSISLDIIPDNITTSMPVNIHDPNVVNRNETSPTNVSHVGQTNETSLLDIAQTEQENNTSPIDLPVGIQGNETSLVNSSQTIKDNKTSISDSSEAGLGNETSLLDSSLAAEGNKSSRIEFPVVDRNNTSVSLANVSEIDIGNHTIFENASDIGQENQTSFVDVNEENKLTPLFHQFNTTSLMPNISKTDSIPDQGNDTLIGQNDDITTVSLLPKANVSMPSVDSGSAAILITTNEPVNVLPSVLTTENVTSEPLSVTLPTSEHTPTVNETDDNKANNETASEHVQDVNVTMEPQESSTLFTSPWHLSTTAAHEVSTDVHRPNEIRLQSKMNEHIMTINGTGVEPVENTAISQTDPTAMDESVQQPMVETTTGLGASVDLFASETTTLPVTQTLHPDLFNLVHMYGITAYTSESTLINCHVKRAVNWIYVTIRANTNWKPVHVTLYPTGDIRWRSKTTRHDVMYSIIESNNGPGDNITLGMIIKDLECLDAMDFTCQLHTETVNVKNRSHLTIVGKPDRNIKLTLGPSIIEKRAFRITASWQAGYPAPWAELFWSAVDAQGKRYNLADYGDYQDVQLLKDDKSCQTFLIHSIVIFPKMYLNDTTVAVGADVTKARYFVDDIKKPILDEVQPGVQKILVIPLNYCDRKYTDVSVAHPFETCTKFIRCLPDDLSVQLCPRGTCFFQGAQKCG